MQLRTYFFLTSTVADIRFVVNMCQAFPPMIFLLFVGPWSDQFGRKFILLCPLVGFLYSDMIYLIASIFFYELPVEFLMLEMFKNFFGGGGCVWMGVYSYVSGIFHGVDYLV